MRLWRASGLRGASIWRRQTINSPTSDLRQDSRGPVVSPIRLSCTELAGRPYAGSLTSSIGGRETKRQTRLRRIAASCVRAAPQPARPDARHSSEHQRRCAQFMDAARTEAQTSLYVRHDSPTDPWHALIRGTTRSKPPPTNWHVFAGMSERGNQLASKLATGAERELRRSCISTPPTPPLGRPDIVEHALVVAPVGLHLDVQVEVDLALGERARAPRAASVPICLIIAPPRPTTIGFCDSRSTRIVQ